MCCNYVAVSNSRKGVGVGMSHSVAKSYVVLFSRKTRFFVLAVYYIDSADVQNDYVGLPRACPTTIRTPQTAVLGAIRAGDESKV